MSEQRGRGKGMGLGAVLKHFAHVEVPRVARARVHSLVAILTMALCGVICGAESWVEIAEYGRAKADWFATFLDLPNGIPSHDTFGQVFARLDAATFEAGFAAWMQAVAAALPFQPLEATAMQAVVALDGKTLRRSHDRGAGKLALQLVSAWASANHLVLTQQAVLEKSNEITAFPPLLRQLDLAGCLVVIDAMGCQTAIAEQIVEQDAGTCWRSRRIRATSMKRWSPVSAWRAPAALPRSPRARGATGGKWARGQGARAAGDP